MNSSHRRRAVATARRRHETVAPAPRGADGHVERAKGAPAPLRSEGAAAASAFSGSLRTTGARPRAAITARLRVAHLHEHTHNQV